MPLTWIRISLLAAFAAIAWPAHAETLKITQKKNGRSIEVKPRKLKAEHFQFDHAGKTFDFPLEQLTEDSRQRIEDWNRKQAAAAKEVDAAINEAVGLPLFQPNLTLWEEPAGDVAKRLNWPMESKSPGNLSFRDYPRSTARFIGARPYCCTLYGGSESKAQSLSIVYANKGDFNSVLGRGEDHFKKVVDGVKVDMTLNEAIQRDIETISAALTLALGEPSEQRYGEKTGRRDALRWDHRGHSFILSEREDEYAHLLVVDEQTADRQGRAQMVKDSDFRDMLLANIKREEHGDVLITNIPMVDQGPKGYCAPATFERAMRYMQVPADMYLLATLATDPHGGTMTHALADEAKRIISSKARRIKELELEDDLDLGCVKRYVDKGVPILWQMASVPSYNEAINQFSSKRAGTVDFSDWKAEVEFITDALLPVLSNKTNHHICMIIGYNEKTGEIAVSDSWGPSYELRWVPIKVAQAVTTSGGFVIDL